MYVSRKMFAKYLMCTENAQHERGCQAWRTSKVKQMLKLSVVKREKNKQINKQ